MIDKRNIETNILRMIIFVLFILGCIFLFLVGQLVYKEIFKKSIKIEYYQNRLSAEVKRIDAIIESAQKTPQDLAYILEFHDADNSETKILLESVLFNNEELFGSAIAYEPYAYNKETLYYSPYLYRQGDTVAYTNLDDPEYNYFYKDWYLVPKTLKKPIWSEPYYDSGGGNLLMSTYSVPFYKFDGNKDVFCGIITVDVSVEWLTNAVKSIGKALNGEAILISENGTIISSMSKKWTYNETIFTLATEMKLPILREIGRDLQQGKSGVKKIQEFEKSREWMAFYSSVKTNKWGLILLIPEKELTRK